VLGGDGDALYVRDGNGPVGGEGEGEGGVEEDTMICSCSKGRFFVFVSGGGGDEESSS